MNNEREDMPSQSERDYFKKILSSHDNIKGFTEIDNQLFKVERKKPDESSLFIYLSGLYTVGIVDCMDIIECYSDVNCIVTSSIWNSYTEDAKEYAKSKKVGLFIIKEFMGALNIDDFWAYVKRDNQGKSINFSRGSDS